MIDELDKKIFSNTAYQILGKLVTSFLGFVSTALIARYLGATLFGQFSLIYVFLGLASIFADFGLVTLLIREVAAKKANARFLSGILTLRLFSSLLVIFVSLAILQFFPYPAIVKKGIVVSLIGSLFLNLSSVYWGIFQAKLNFLKVVLIQVFSSLISTVLVILGVVKLLPFDWFVFCFAIANLGGFLLSFFRGPKITIFLDFGLFKKIFGEVWPIGLGAIVTTFYFKFDSLLLSLFYNPSKFSDLGHYSAAYKYFEVAGVFAGFFQTTTFPLISANLKKKNFRFLYKKLLIYEVILAILAGFGLWLLSKPFILLYGKEFSPAIKSLKILSLALGMMVLSGIWLSVGVAGGRQKTLFGFSLVALFLNLILNFLVIPRYSYIGASWTTVLTQVFIAVTNFLVAEKVVRERQVW
jgi:O-antigen/teichoic acid export membrane protein